MPLLTNHRSIFKPIPDQKRYTKNAQSRAIQDLLSLEMLVEMPGKLRHNFLATQARGFANAIKHVAGRGSSFFGTLG